MSKVWTGIDRSKSFRVYLTITTDLVEKARKIHDTTPLATAGLGRVLTGTGLMGLFLKNKEDKVTVQFKGDGPAAQILATADGGGRVKGYISNPDVELPLTNEGKLDVGGSLGIGELTVIKDLGLKEPYMGKIALVSGEIADDLTAYYYISEQQNSSVALGVKINKDLSVMAAGGMIIQMLPSFDEASVDALEAMLEKMKPLTTLIEEAMLRSMVKTQEGILADLVLGIFGEMPEEYLPELMEYRDLNWLCDCCRERLERVLMTIGREDLETILREDKQAELVCQFCTTTYQFDEYDLKKIIERL